MAEAKLELVGTSRQANLPAVITWRKESTRQHRWESTSKKVEFFAGKVG